MLNISEYQRLLQCVKNLEDALELEEAIETEHAFKNYTEIKREISNLGLLSDHSLRRNNIS